MPKNIAASNTGSPLQVLSNISMRLADMHDAGYAHRDLKPANVMWLPRANRWTIIDFGCVARVGEAAPLSFTLVYAAPEVARAFFLQQGTIESTPALDAWSLGVMAFELLTGAPAYNLLADGRSRVSFLYISLKSNEFVAAECVQQTLSDWGPAQHRKRSFAFCEDLNS